MISSRALLAGAAVVPVGAVSAALFTQHGLGMTPCAWCVLQRLIFLVIAAWALLGWAWNSAAGRRVGAAGMLVFAACGVAAATYQHFVASNSLSCGFSLADRIISGLKLDALVPAVFMPMASCAEAKAILMGMPYEFWSFSLFVLLGITAVRVLARPMA